MANADYDLTQLSILNMDNESADEKEEERVLHKLEFETTERLL